MPVYNAERRLERAAQSVLEQDYRNVELVLVNDGSTDRSEQVARRLAQADSRVRLISQANGGVSKARNAGLKVARGAYIAFLDADDWLEENALTFCVETLLHHGSDMVRFNNFVHRNDGVGVRPTSQRGRRVLSKKAELDALTKSLELGQEPGYVWAMVIDAPLARSVQFQENVAYYEDLIYTLELIRRARRVSITDRPLHHYDQTGTSATRDPTRAAQIRTKMLQGEAAVLDKLVDLHASDLRYLKSTINGRLKLLSRALSTPLVGKDLDVLELSSALGPFMEEPGVLKAAQYASTGLLPAAGLSWPPLSLRNSGSANATALYRARHITSLSAHAAAVRRIGLQRTSKKIWQLLLTRTTSGRGRPGGRAKPERPLVWVQTMRQVTNNYGCLLQATALQKVLTTLGYTVITNAVSAPAWSWKTLPGYALQLLRTGSLDDLSTIAMRRDPYKALIDFAGEHLSVTDRNYGTRFLPWPQRYHSAKFAVTGSDQVWRPQYMDVLWGAFGYLPRTSPKRISYAASFGVDDLKEFDPTLKAQFGAELGKFHRISVRERSGVRLCREGWGLEATQTLDPTLLLSKSDWLRYAGETNQTRPERHLAYMVLDPDPELYEISQRIAQHQGLTLVEFYPPKVTTRSAYLSNPIGYRLPAVADWLRLIDSAELVVTDSFHVSVFSILFESSFYTIKNEERGATRFESLAATLGLQAPFISRSEFTPRLQPPEIDWQNVQENLVAERKRSLDFLRDALS